LDKDLAAVLAAVEPKRTAKPSSRKKLARRRTNRRRWLRMLLGAAVVIAALMGWRLWNHAGPGVVVGRYVSTCPPGQRGGGCGGSVLVIMQEGGRTKAVRVDSGSYRACGAGEQWPTCAGVGK
jgi:hypothetical protein